jgi:hypothetical protein
MCGAAGERVAACVPSPVCPLSLYPFMTHGSGCHVKASSHSCVCDHKHMQVSGLLLPGYMDDWLKTRREDPEWLALREARRQVGTHTHARTHTHKH